jgi:hypothetical protein
MIADPRVNIPHGHRLALWLFTFAVVVPAILCPAQAGTAAAARMCVTAVGDAPDPETVTGVTPRRAEAAVRIAAPGSASALRTAEAAGPCTPPRPHRPPCGAVTHAQPRTAGSWQSGAGVGCPLPAAAVTEPARPGPACSGSSRPPAARSGAGLLIGLCASRT